MNLQVGSKVIFYQDGAGHDATVSRVHDKGVHVDLDVHWQDEDGNEHKTAEKLVAVSESRLDGTCRLKNED